MFPERLPHDVDSDAERRLFHEFKSQFGDDFVVFSRVRWLARRRGGRARDGEADFVVAHPRYGALVLEVKGGGVEFEASSGKYFSTDKAGMRHEIKDPFEQATTSMHALLSKLKESELTGSFKYPMGHAVIVPDIYVEGDLNPAAPRETVIDAAKVNTLKQAVIDAFRYFGMGNGPPGEEAMEALIELLGRSWQIEATIGTELDAQETAIRLLTEQQFAVLDLLGSQRRALISGCAGSGKTMLAMEKARRLARDGYRVLLTCFNVNLGNWLASQMGGDGVTAQRFLSLCATYAEKAGTPLAKRPGESDQQFFDRFPDALDDALRLLPDRFDAIIVDEGQDFKEEWWAALLSLLEDPDDGVLYIFYDDNQNLYECAPSYPITSPPYHLSQNRRNTKRIHEAVMMFYQSDARTKPDCIAPEGREIHNLEIDPGAPERRQVEGYIDGLVTEQKVRPGDIAVLTRRGRENSEWRACPKHASWSATWDLADSGDRVLCSSIHGFKGLERPVVVVCELGGVNAGDPDDQRLLYVALSRAREYLVVAGAGKLAPAT
jgi:hypothetical protein